MSWILRGLKSHHDKLHMIHMSVSHETYRTSPEANESHKKVIHKTYKMYRALVQVEEVLLHGRDHSCQEVFHEII